MFMGKLGVGWFRKINQISIFFLFIVSLTNVDVFADLTESFNELDGGHIKSYKNVNKLEKKPSKSSGKEIKSIPSKKTKSTPIPTGNIHHQAHESKDKSVSNNSHLITTKKSNNHGNNLEEQKNIPVIFEGDQFSGFRKLGTLELIENVKVTQGDFVIVSNNAKVFFDTKTDDVKKVIAKGNVKMNKTDLKTGEPITAQSKLVKFDAIKQVVELIGDAELTRGEDKIKGSTIIYELNTGWIKAKKVKGVVKAKEQPSSVD